MHFLIQHYENLPSTNAEAARLAHEGAAEGTAIFAKHQTAGVGKGGRVWISEPGNLAMSLIVRPEKTPLYEAQQLVYVAAVAAHQALQSHGISTKLKWPNDILLEGKKLGGILLESGYQQDRLDYVVIGIGINLAHAPEGLPQPATSLENKIKLDDIEKSLLTALSHFYTLWEKEGFAPIRKEWLKQAYGLNQMTLARTPEGDKTGIMQGINEAGDLLLLGEGGISHKIITADLFIA